MYYYKIFGLTFSSQVNFSLPLAQIPSTNAVDCEIVQIFEPTIGSGWRLTYSRRFKSSLTPQTETLIFSSEQGLLFSQTDVGYFIIQPRKIAFFKNATASLQELENRLFQGAIFLWLELNRMHVLHASGVAINQLGIGFLGKSTSGKSTLATAFMRQGVKLFTDDVFIVEKQADKYQVRPGYNLLRILPDTARTFGFETSPFNPESKKNIIPFDKAGNIFCSEPIPLITLYLLERKNEIDSVFITPFSNKQAYLVLLQHALAAMWLDQIQNPINSSRMKFFADLIKVVSVKRLVYPSGYEYLPDVIRTIKKDVGL